MDSMHIDTPNHSNRDVPLRLLLRPVKPLESGEGLPYAPENWPKPGDTWGWKVGPRITNNGHFVDRYLYPPKRLRGLASEALQPGKAFRSKSSVDRYIRSAFPKADVRKFFASFSWRIPSTDGTPQKQCLLPVDSSDEDPMPEDGTDIPVCKAGNGKCGSLLPPSETKPLPAMPCDICCSEPNFCTDCCCILCCKPISLEHEGYSFIKCEAVVSEGHICGHVAHVNCSLRAYMAGTIGGSIGLDAEYYCRRCDARKDLVPHVNKFLNICQNVEHQGGVEKILNLGISILQGSKRDNAKELSKCIKSTIRRLKCGSGLEDLWNGNTQTTWSELAENGEAKDNESLQDVTPMAPIPFNHEAEMHKHSEEIREVLIALRKAQESEYQLAESKLHSQKDCVDDLYRKLDKEKSKLARHATAIDAESLMTNVLKRLDQIRKEVTKLKEMEKVAQGFGRTPRRILEDYFHLRIEE